jgi:carbamoyl-phosphate synthase large subunit
MKIIRTAVGSMVTWGMIEELQKLGIEVIGVDADFWSYAFELLDNYYVIPKANKPDFIKKLFGIAKYEKVDAIISGPEEELLILSKWRETFEREGIMILCPEYESIEFCIDKLKLNEFLRGNGIPVPKIYDEKEISSDYENAPHTKLKWRFGRGGKKIETQIENYLLHQEYIKGIEYSVDVLADKEGNTLNMVPRIREKVVDGKSVMCKTIVDKEIMTYCRKIVKKLKLFGPSCIQCIENEKGIYFIDINPRFGGGSILSIKADPTFLFNLIQLIKGEIPIPSNTFKEGLTMMRYYKEVYI